MKILITEYFIFNARNDLFEINLHVPVRAPVETFSIVVIKYLIYSLKFYLQKVCFRTFNLF